MLTIAQDAFDHLENVMYTGIFILVISASTTKKILLHTNLPLRPGIQNVINTNNLKFCDPPLLEEYIQISYASDNV